MLPKFKSILCNFLPKLYVTQFQILVKNYLVPIQKREFLDKVKEREDCNHRNTLKYFEDYNLSMTQRLFKRAVSGWALPNKILMIR